MAFSGANDALRLPRKRSTGPPDRLIHDIRSGLFVSLGRLERVRALRRSIRILAKAADILQPNHGVPRQFLFFLLIGLLRPLSNVAHV
jgi:hypothetical protein